MIVRPPSERPEKLAVGFLHRRVVDAGVAVVHQSLVIELPVLIAVTPVPVAGIVVPFVSEANGNAAPSKCPELLDESVVEFALPLACEEDHDRLAPGGKFGPIAPLAIKRVRECYARGVP